LQRLQHELQLEETAVIDLAPPPYVSYKRAKRAREFVGTVDYGVCSGKAMKYSGYKLHSVVSLTGLILGYLLTPASRYDNQLVLELLDSFSHHLTRLLGDGAYNDAAFASSCQREPSTTPVAVCSKTAQPLALDRRNGQCPVDRAIALVQALRQ
jgi:Transposase DDE domain